MCETYCNKPFKKYDFATQFISFLTFAQYVYTGIRSFIPPHLAKVFQKQETEPNDTKTTVQDKYYCFTHLSSTSSLATNRIVLEQNVVFFFCPPEFCCKKRPPDISVIL
jgi:hypothetical protein